MVYLNHPPNPSTSSPLPGACVPATAPCKYTYRYVGHVVPAIEKSDLHQVLGRKRPSSRLSPPFAVLCARRASPCSPLPTLLGGARRCSRRLAAAGVVFVLESKLLFRSLIFVRINTNQSDMCYVKN